MRILHIHQDYPDGRPYPFTKAVSNLVEACQELNANDEHVVLSINRTSNPFKVSCKKFEQGLSLVYWAIPLPFIYYLSMKLSAFYIFSKIKKLKIDIIHGHKLTSEGVFAYFLSKKVAKPYVLSIRGGSDIHNIKRLNVHNKFFKKVFTQSSQVFWVSAWAKETLPRLLSIKEVDLKSNPLLPNICNINLSYKHHVADSRQVYITAISFHQYKRKGIPELIKAISKLKQQGINIKLDIYGSGDEAYKAEIVQLIEQAQVNSQVKLKGQVAQSELLTAMAQSKGFLMPAINETFGMVYIEALSVGCPILYVQNTGVDGYFDDDVGEKIKDLRKNELTNAIQSINENNFALCQTLKKIQGEKGLIDFTSSHVAKHYLSFLKQVPYA